jgi:hypothetical protein
LEQNTFALAFQFNITATAYHVLGCNDGIKHARGALLLAAHTARQMAWVQFPSDLNALLLLEFL